MWAKFRDQIPAVIITAIITVGALIGYTVWQRQQVVKELTEKQQQELAALKESTEARLKEANDALRTQMDATYALLKDAIEKRKGELFINDEELAKLNQEKIDTLAKALAEKIQPYGMPLPKDPQQAQEQRNQQVDEVATRMAGKIQPILDQMSHDQSLTKESIAGYGQKILDQIAVVLTGELAAKQKLNNNLLEVSSVAQDSMRISQELTALYIDQIKDESLFGRILTLPARVLQDTARGSIVNSNERKKIEARLADDMKRLQARLEAVKSNMPQPTATADRAAPSRP